MNSIFNNPFRILGLPSSASDIDIYNRYNELRTLIEEGKTLRFPYDDFFNAIEIDGKSYLENTYKPFCIKDDNNFKLVRTMDSIQNAISQLHDPVSRKYYSLFAFDCLAEAQIKTSPDLISKSWISELALVEVRVNRFSYCHVNDYFEHFISEINESYEIIKSYKEINVKHLDEYSDRLKPTGFSATLTENSNFSIECDSQWVEGIENQHFGMFWGWRFMDHKLSYFTFGISANGYIYITDVENGTFKQDDPEFPGWKKTSTINKNQKNHLEVRKNEDSIEFYVNSNLVHKTNNYRKLYGNEIGISISGKQTVNFSNFKINYYNTEIDFDNSLDINKYSFSLVKNLALYYFIKSFIDRNLPSSDQNNRLLKLDQNESYSSIMKYYADRALLLFRRIYCMSVLVSIGILEETQEDVFITLSDRFINDLYISLEQSFDNVHGIEYSRLVSLLKRFDPPFFRRFFEYQKNKLPKGPLKIVENKDQYTCLTFPINIQDKSFFTSISNNPFRVLGLPPTASIREISKRSSDLIIYDEMNRSKEYLYDLFFGKVDRSASNVQDCLRKLENPNIWAYYSLLWFHTENQLDKDFVEALQIIDRFQVKEQLREVFLYRFRRFQKEGMSYPDANNEINNYIIENAPSLSAHLNIKQEHNATSYCLFNNIISRLPLNYNTVKNGDSIILNSLAKKGFSISKEIYFDKSVDFKIEVDCEWIEGENFDQSFGILFGKNVNSNNYKFGISQNGCAYLDGFLDHDQRKIQIKPLKEKLKSKTALSLSYISESGALLLAINHDYIGTTNYPFSSYIHASPLPFKGDYIGLFVSDNQKIAFSNYKITYIDRFNREAFDLSITDQNFSSAINYALWNLCDLNNLDYENFYNHIAESIALIGKLINSDSLIQHVNKIFGQNTRINTIDIEKHFADDIIKFAKHYLDSESTNFSTKDFVNSFYTFSTSTQEYVAHKILVSSINTIEESIIKTRKQLKENSLKGNDLGQKLYDITEAPLIEIRKVISYTNLQYRLLANKLSDSILDCAIAYFNAIRENREATFEEGSSSLNLIKLTNLIVVDGSSRVRVDENLEFFQTWIARHKPPHVFHNEQSVKSDSTVEMLKKMLSDFKEHKPTTTLLCKSFVQDSLRFINRIQAEGSMNTEDLSMISNNLVASVLTFLIDDIALREIDLKDKPVIKEVEFEIHLENVGEILTTLLSFKTNQVTHDRLKHFQQKINLLTSAFHEPLIPKDKSPHQNNQSNIDQLRNVSSENQKKETDKSTGTSFKPHQPVRVDTGNILNEWKRKFLKLNLDNKILLILMPILSISLLVLLLTHPIHTPTKSAGVNQPNTTELPTKSWEGYQLNTGNTPYANYFGNGIFDYSTSSWLKINNSNSTDAIICLQNYYSGKTVRHIYIRAGESFTFYNLPNGTYSIKSFKGRDWNPDKLINNNSIRGAFETQKGFVSFDNPSDLIQIYDNGRQYSTDEITLYTTTSRGASNIRSINSSDFFK